MDFDELYEQLFDDLDSDEFEKRLPQLFVANPEYSTCMSGFLAAVRAVDESITTSPTLRDPGNLLESRVWAALREASRRVLEIPAIDKLMQEAQSI